MDLQLRRRKTMEAEVEEAAVEVEEVPPLRYLRGTLIA
jgi:hypothetical protein